MEFYELMLNLCIGILGGIFSSLIVSRIFLIQSLYSEQISRIQEHFEYIYNLDGQLLYYLYRSESDVTLNGIEISTLNDYLLQNIKKTSKNECDKFRYMIFDDLETDLYKIAEDLNDLMERLDLFNDINRDAVSSVHDEIIDLQKRFRLYKSNNKKYLKKQIIHDNILRLLFLITLVLISTTILAYFI